MTILKMCLRSLALLLLVSVSDASAGSDFGEAQTLTPQDDGLGMTPLVATDGNGTWVILWLTDKDPTIFAGGTGYTFSRSTDDGVTWSARQPLRPGFQDTANWGASMATDKQGKWIIVLSAPLRTMTSTDNGATWSAPENIDVTVSSVHPLLGTDGAGTWVIVWNGYDANFNSTVIVATRSTDDAATWSSPVAIGDLHYPDSLATDGNGTWIATWGSTSTQIVRSTDNGATWSAPLAIRDGMGMSGSKDVATDGAGNWIVVWPYLGIESSRSTDNGATWSVAAPLHPYFDGSDAYNAGFHDKATVVALPSGEWQVVWASNDGLRKSLGTDSDHLTSYSNDGGVSWSAPAALTISARRDGVVDDYFLDVAASPTGRTVVAEGTQFTPGDVVDNWIFGINVVTSNRDCPLVAREDCLRSTEPTGSSVFMRDKAGGGDRMSWRLNYVEATSDMDLGDPTAADEYVLCLYETVNAAPGLIGEWDARAGQTCGAAPCWSKAAGEVELNDGVNYRGSIRKLTIRGGAEGEASIKLKAQGPALALPSMPLDTTAPVRIQLANLGTGTCWEGVHDQATTNQIDGFKSRSN